MKAACLLLSLALIGGCEQDEPAANQTKPMSGQATPALADNGGDTDETVTPPMPSPPVAQSKPLVSRGTPSPRTTEPDYRAIGTEPFWAVTIRGTKATLERPDKGPVRFSVRADEDGKAIRYQGDGFAMTLTQGPCSDGMSDAIWSDRVQVAFAEGALKGCGGLREDMREETP